MMITNASRTILIVEDDDAIRTMLVDTLADDGFATREAADGLTGVAQARMRPPDAILLDLMLPRLDGNGVLAALEEDPRLAQVPVIVTSAYPQRLKAHHQVRKVIAKPFDIWELLKAVREVVN